MGSNDIPEGLPPGYRVISDGVCGEEIYNPTSAGMADSPGPRYRINEQGDKELLPGALVRYTPSRGGAAGGCALVLDRGEFPLFKIIPDANPACWPPKVAMLYVQCLPPGAAVAYGNIREGSGVHVQFPELWEDAGGVPEGSPYKMIPWPGGHPCGWVMERMHGFPGNEVGNLLWEVME